jgi:ribA/ribD-fused uncharacterized protein
MKRVDFYDACQQFGELSNYFVLSKPMKYKGLEYASSEHLYQALKFMYTGASQACLAYAETIRCAKTPNMAKILASQRVAGGYAWRVALNPVISKSLEDGVAVDPAWADVKEKRMEMVLSLKFAQDAHCCEVLLSTGTAVLSEHTSRDAYWGDGGEKRNGKNVLGNLLMMVRSKIQAARKRKFVEIESPSKKIKLSPVLV